MTLDGQYVKSQNAEAECKDKLNGVCVCMYMTKDYVAKRMNINLQNQIQYFSSFIIISCYVANQHNLITSINRLLNVKKNNTITPSHIAHHSLDQKIYHHIYSHNKDKCNKPKRIRLNYTALNLSSSPHFRPNSLRKQIQKGDLYLP